MKKSTLAIGVTAIFIIFIVGVLYKHYTVNNTSDKLSVTTTLFPLYDFAKAIGGDKVDVNLLLPPGVEPHSFEPTPSDLIKINESSAFIYTGKFMEPWSEDVIKGLTNTKMVVVDASRGIAMMESSHHHDEEIEEHHEGDADHELDPHIWLDFENAQKMLESIKNGIVQIDPNNSSYYDKNYELYNKKLVELDQRYFSSLKSCQNRNVVYGGHFVFGYLAKRYSLNYVAASGISPDAEPSAQDIATLINQIRNDKIKYIFYEELSSPKISETLANETDTKMLLLNGAHNVSKEDKESKVSFLDLMNNNLINLVSGLGCK
jgi:zinc transport system substrate-binding protein